MNDQDYIIFEDYLSGKLSEPETKAFKDRLSEDSDFQKSFQTYKQLSGFLEHEIGNAQKTQLFKNNLKSISNTYFQDKKETKSTKIVTFYKYAVAACVVALLGYFAYNQFSNPVYGDYANYQTISLAVRGNQDNLVKTAESEFNAGHYDKADEVFKSLLKIDENNSEYQFYRALANIETNNYETAEKLLNNLSKGNSVFKNKAIWYLALSKLKQKQYTACVELLKTLPADTEDYKQAQKLLKKLE